MNSGDIIRIVAVDMKRVWLKCVSSTGIGRAVVKALAQCGAEVVAFSRTQADLDSLKTEVWDTTSMHTCVCVSSCIKVCML